MLWFGTPNTFSYAALVLWGPITLVLFARLKPPLATALALVGGMLFLPEVVSFNPPILPVLDKSTIPGFAAIVGCLSTAAGRKRLAAARPFRGIDLWFLLLLAGDAGTVLTNLDTLDYGVPKPGLKPTDVIAAFIGDLFTVYTPFLLGRAMFRTIRDLRTLLVVCVGGALIYAPLCLFETVMSPVLHVHVYGFMQHDIRQTLRGGGFRPMVFMTHGIPLSRFLLVAVLSALVLYRGRLMGAGAGVAAGALLLVLLACRSAGAIVLGAVLVPLIAWGSVTMQVRAAAVLAIIVATYPLSRGSDLFPVETLLEWSAAISEQRTESLGARFEQEDTLLAHARERPLFGWGASSRAHVFDPVTGEDITTVDGEWIIVFGMRGLIGFIAWYGLYLAPVFVARRSQRRIGLAHNRALLAGFALIGVLLAVESLPNASATIPQFMWSGALYGIARHILRQDRMARLKAVWSRRRRAPTPTPVTSLALPRR
jgi:hypothetical protein